MPKITINGTSLDFTPGQMIIQVANAAGIDIPQYCYHDALSIVASCRICLAEVWQPNPRNNNALEPIPKLIPTCQTACADGMVVYTDSPKAVANQKAVMEYLLINHPLDCPVCDQSGECFLQDYSYEYGRGVSRFEETKIKNPKKDIGPHVYLYADRCIMCTRCVRFTREVSGTSELTVQGRGNKEEIDIFPGIALDNELSANVIDLCPVGALLDKDFLFAQRVWFLKSAPSIDGLTASGDNITVDTNDAKIYRLRPRTNMAVNKWWISDEIRYSWKHVHSDGEQGRLRSPRRTQFGAQVDADWSRALLDAAAALRGTDRGSERSVSPRVGVLVSPMLSCEDAYPLARLALAVDPRAVLAVGPVPTRGQDKTFPPTDPNGYKVYAEKAPNARGVKRVLSALAASAGNKAQLVDLADFTRSLRSGHFSAAILTGNYPSAWAPQDLLDAARSQSGGGDKTTIILLDTLASTLADAADILLPSSTWLEKSGTFENAKNMLQAFEAAIPPVESSKPEAQIALDLLAILGGAPAIVEFETLVVSPAKQGQVPDAVRILDAVGQYFNAADTRTEMSRIPGLETFATTVAPAILPADQSSDMQMVEL
ncbi:MAG TPA: 2Fe-2S iron-sulfur cluster-binding protein [Phycisphaerales bacterium]|nr:2Fe-2S iron-sulfur cluster-binding protein [Phycisphaerales bacterium]